MGGGGCGRGGWAGASLVSRGAVAQPSPLADLRGDGVGAGGRGDPDSTAVKALQRAVRSRFDERVSGGAVVRAIQRRMSGVGEADATERATEDRGGRLCRMEREMTLGLR